MGPVDDDFDDLQSEIKVEKEQVQFFEVLVKKKNQESEKENDRMTFRIKDEIFESEDSNESEVEDQYELQSEIKFEEENLIVNETLVKRELPIQQNGYKLVDEAINSEITFEHERLPLSKNLENIDESFYLKEYKIQDVFESEIKVEEEQIHISNLLVMREDTENSCTICKSHIIRQNEFCMLCSKPLCSECIQYCLGNSQNQEFSRGSFIICTNCSSRKCFISCEKVQDRIKEKVHSGTIINANNVNMRKESGESVQDHFLPQETFQCSDCPKIFSSKSALDYHSVIHVGFSGQLPSSSEEIEKTKVRGSGKQMMKTAKNNHILKINIKRETCVVCKEQIVFIKQSEDKTTTNQGSNHVTCIFCSKSLCSRCEEKCQKDGFPGSIVCTHCRSRECFVSCEKIPCITENLNDNEINSTNHFVVDRPVVRNENNSNETASKQQYSKISSKRALYNYISICVFCEKKFTSKKVYFAHMETHKNDELKCYVCVMTFENLTALQRHYTKYHSEKPFECADCGRRFQMKRNLYAHVVLRTCRQIFRCKLCEREFKYKHNRDYHIKTVHANDFLKCKICSKMCRNIGAFRFHMTHHHTEKRFECAHCGRKFASKAPLVPHVETHRTVRALCCQFCPSRFKRQIILQLHEKFVHGYNELVFECPTCPKKLRSKGQLRSHIRNIHVNGNPFKCPKCPKAYKTKRDLTYHLETHNTEATHKCLHCGRCYKGKNQLFSHIDRYHGGYKYFCTTCSIFVKTQSKLSEHKETTEHKDQRLKQLKSGVMTNKKDQILIHKKVFTNYNKCHICGKTYTQKQALQYHLEQHENKTFPCEICSVLCRSRRALTHHRRQNHKEKRFECTHCGKKFAMKCLLTVHIGQHSTEHVPFA
ncbi:hypothetical protein DMENIID0001_155850 [Sergentomyia squamirostris]